MQTFIVILIVLIAGLYVLRRFQKSYLSKNREACTGCCGCSGSTPGKKTVLRDLREEKPSSKIHGD